MKQQTIVESLQVEIDSIYENDQVKPVCAPFYTLGSEIVSKLPATKGRVLVISDLGLLLAVLRRFNSEQVTFVAHTPEQEKFAQDLMVNTWQVGYNDPIKELEKKTMGLKFDIIVGNPPYQSDDQQSLFVDFLQVSIKLTEDRFHLIFITPGNWLSKASGDLAWFRSCIQDRASFLSYMSKEDCQKKLSWPAIIGGVTWFHLTDRQSEIVSIENKTRNESFEVSRSDLNVLPSFPINAVNAATVASILTKCRTARTMDSLHRRGKIGSKVVEQLPAGEVTCHMSRGRTRNVQWQDDFVKDFKLAFNYANGSKLVSAKIVQPGETLTESFLFFVGKDQTECANIQSFIDTDLVHFLRKLVTFDHNATAKTFSLVPVVEFSQSWDNERVFKHFSLTEDEISVIKESVKIPDTF